MCIRDSWENDGYELLHMKDEGYKVGSTNHNLDYIFKRSIVWTKVTSSLTAFRYSDMGFLFDDAAGLCAINDERATFPVLGLLNSPVAIHYLGGMALS